MISTFQALEVALLALLPGASYTFAYERLAGAFGVKFSDRLVRFLAASAVFAAIFSGPAFTIYRHWIATGRLARGHVSAWVVECVALAYVLLPTLLGSLVGYGAKRRWRWLRPVVGETPEPRAWDYLWRRGIQAVLRIRLKSGTWLAGMYATTDGDRRSYAAGYPEDQDLYLSVQLKADPDTGAFETDADERPIPVEGGGGLLLRWDEVEYLEIQEF